MKSHFSLKNFDKRNLKEEILDEKIHDKNQYRSVFFEIV